MTENIIGEFEEKALKFLLSPGSVKDGGSSSASLSGTGSAPESSIGASPSSLTCTA